MLVRLLRFCFLCMLGLSFSGCGVKPSSTVKLSDPDLVRVPGTNQHIWTNCHRRWFVRGRITDSAGDPLPGVQVSAHCGIGTLMKTGQTVTDDEGRYYLRFATAYQLASSDTDMQFANISPSFPGMVERNLGRAGELLMARDQPTDEELAYWNVDAERVLIRREGRHVDFVMVPAAIVRGRVTDSTGAPVANTSIWLDADELPPSSSVLASATTDENGRFEYTEVPPGQVWLTMPVSADPCKEVDSAKIQCDAAMAYEVELTLRRAPAEGLDVRLIKRVAVAHVGRS